MMIETISNIMGDYTALIFIALYLSGIAMLLKSMRTQDQLIRDQAVVISALRVHVAKSVKTQLVTHDQVDELRDRCNKLLARQERIETRAPDSGRIDLAIRMLKRGNGNTQALHDLGLSDGEAKLLVRLHQADTSLKHTTPSRPPLAAQGQALAQILGS